MSITHAPRPVILALASTFAMAGCTGHVRLQLPPDDPRGQGLRRVVDSKPARELLADLLVQRAGDRLTPPEAFETVLGRAGEAGDTPVLPLLDDRTLRELGEAVSVDYAALVFARMIGNDERSRAVQKAFSRALAEGPARSEAIVRSAGSFPYTVLFSPGWLYQSHSGSGANFARQRQLLDRLGVVNRLIETAESGSVEDNAAMIVAATRAAARDGADVILVSTSKASAETALALSLLGEAEAAVRVVGWLNIGGALHGTPLADSGLRPPVSWITRLIFRVMGWNRAGLVSMQTEPSRQRLKGRQLPDSVAVVNLVAVPVSGSVSRKVRGSYRMLRKHGPNDGVVLLADTVWPGGANLLALGSDHLLAEFQQDAEGLALLRAVDYAVRLHRARRAKRGGVLAGGPGAFPDFAGPGPASFAVQ